MAAQTLKFKDYLLEIEHDDNPESPRDWDNLGIMAYQYRDYKLGDIEIPKAHDWEDFLQTQDLTKHDLAICLPLFVYEHSGITMTCGERVYPFNDRWDSSMVGFIYVTYEKLRKEYSKKRISKKTLKIAEKVLRSEVETFDTYLRGDIYGFTLSKLVKCDHNDEHKEHIDSCWGFYGFDHQKSGLAENIDDFDKFTEAA